MLVESELVDPPAASLGDTVPVELRGDLQRYLLELRVTIVSNRDLSKYRDVRVRRPEMDVEIVSDEGKGRSFRVSNGARWFVCGAEVLFVRARPWEAYLWLLRAEGSGNQCQQEPGCPKHRMPIQLPSPFRDFGLVCVVKVCRFPRLCRIASYITTAPATETFNEDTLPVIGIRTR